MNNKETKDLTLKLWRDLAETGKRQKQDTLAWSEVKGMLNYCPLCELFWRTDDEGFLTCVGCPLSEAGHRCNTRECWEEEGDEATEPDYYSKWCYSGDPVDRMSAAAGIVRIVEAWDVE